MQHLFSVQSIAPSSKSRLRIINCAKSWACSASSSIAGLTLVGCSVFVHAAPYPPLADAIDVHTGSDFRIIPDIDNDGRADAITVADGVPGSGLPCPSMRIHRSSTLSDGVYVSDDAGGQLVLSNTSYFASDNGCGPIGRIEVIGDVNADGFSDLAITVINEPAVWTQSAPQLGAVIFNPGESASIELSELNGTNGFIVENANHLRNAGDINGDGFEDTLIDNVAVSGGVSFAGSYDIDAIPDDLLLINSSLEGGLSAIGDVNGDGSDDILVGKINRVNQFAIVYGEPSLSLTLSNPQQLSEQYLMQKCGVSFNCQIEPAGDFDGDGYDDLAVSHFGCGYADEAAVIYGTADGIPRRRAIEDYSGLELTRFVDNRSGGCLSGSLEGTPGDLDNDDSHELYLTLGVGSSDAANPQPSGAIVFGTHGSRPDFISADELDGTNGFRLDLPDHFNRSSDSVARLAGPGRGVDVDGDGYTDLLDEAYDNGDPASQGLFSGTRVAVLGKDREIDTAGPRHFVVEQLSEGWQARWTAPLEGSPARYRVILDGDVAGAVDVDLQSIMLPDSLQGPFQLEVQALTDTGVIIGTTLRQVPARINAENISANIYGETLLELVFDWPSPWLRGGRYQVWRNGELLALPQEGADGYWDATTQAGETYTYFITPLYSIFNDVGSAAALRERPVLQRRSNSVTVTMPGGDPGDSGDPGDGGNGDSITITGNVISWDATGWHQVQSMDDYVSICEGGTECEVVAGRYVVINHDTGERFSDIVVEDSNSLATVEVDGQTISWPDDGWYQVQDASSFASLCEGRMACDVPAGTYIVINHTTGQRWENIIVPDDSGAAAVYVDGQTIRWTDDGWYQVQNAETYDTLCEGALSCSVATGRYIVINHTTGQRYEDVRVESNGIEPGDGDPGSADDSLAPTDIRLEIYGNTIGELFWNSASGVTNTEIYRDGDLLSLTDGQSYFDGTRVAGVPHLYQLVAIDGDGNRSEPVILSTPADAAVALAGDVTVGNNQTSVAVSGNYAAVVVEERFRENAIHIMERSSASDWSVVQTFPTIDYRVEPELAFDNDTLLVGLWDYSEELADIDSGLEFWEHEYFIIQRDSSGGWIRQEISGFSDSLIPNLGNQYASVDIQGDTAMLGGRNGNVYVFKRNNDGQWVETQTLSSRSTRLIGHSVSLSGNTAVIGSWSPEHSAMAYIYTQDASGLWSQQQALDISQHGSDLLLTAVIGTDTIAIGGFDSWEGGLSNTGYHIYTAVDNGQWTQTQEISVTSLGATSLAINSDRLVIGSAEDGGLVRGAGSVRVYDRATSGMWIETEKLFTDTISYQFGNSVALDGNTVITSARQNDGTGAVYIYTVP